VIFGGRLRALAAAEPGYELREHHDDRDGVFDVAGLPTDRPTWACGPAGLLDALEAHVDELHVERFRPVLAAAGAEGDGGEITFTRSGVVAEAAPGTPVLVAGEAAGALLPSGCRMGICHTCVGTLRSGAVRDLRTGATHDTEGELVRTCVTTPCGPVELDL
jgi:ferredoxin